jgi:hypothetical protein
MCDPETPETPETDDAAARAARAAHDMNALLAHLRARLDDDHATVQRLLERHAYAAQLQEALRHP